MRAFMKKTVPLFILLLMVIAPFTQINAEETDDGPIPRVDGGDESDDIKPGSGADTGDTPEFDRPDYGGGWDEIQGSQNSGQNDGNGEFDVKPGAEESNNPVDEEGRDKDDSTAPGKNEGTGEKDKGKEKGKDKEKDKGKEKASDNDFVSGIWDNVKKGGPLLGLINSVDGTGTSEGNIKLGRNLAKLPISLLKPDMSDGQKAASDLGLFAAEATEDGISWSKRLKDAEAMNDLRNKNPKLFNLIKNGKDAATQIKIGTIKMTNIGKDAVKTNSTFIYAMSKGKDYLNKSKDLLSKGGNFFSAALSKGKDLWSKGKSLFSGPLAKGKDFLSKGKNLFSNTVSKGKSLFSSAVSKGKDFLTKGKDLVSSAVSKGKNLLSKGTSLLSGPISKGKDLINSAVTKGKNLLSKGKNLLSGPLAKGKDLLTKGNNLVKSAVSSGKKLANTVKNSKAFGVAKTFAKKGLGVLSIPGTVSDGISAFNNFKSGNALDGVGKTLGFLGGAATALALLTPAGPIVATAGLVATGASLIIEHRDAIKKGAKKVKDTVVNAAKTAGNKIKNGFKSLGKGIGGLLGG